MRERGLRGGMERWVEGVGMAWRLLTVGTSVGRCLGGETPQINTSSFVVFTIIVAPPPSAASLKCVCLEANDSRSATPSRPHRHTHTHTLLLLLLLPVSLRILSPPSQRAARSGLWVCCLITYMQGVRQPETLLCYHVFSDSMMGSTLSAIQW